MMKYTKLFLIAVMIVPWISIPLVGQKSFKRFLPASIIMSAVVIAESYLARKRKWWWIYERLFSKNMIGEIPLVIGPFFIGSLWILKLTFGNFPLYLALNSLAHWVFSFPVMELLKKYGIGSLVRLKKYQLLSLFLIKSLIMYSVQILVDQIYKKNNDEEELLPE